MQRVGSRATGVRVFLPVLVCFLSGSPPAPASPVSSWPRPAQHTSAETPSELNQKAFELIGQNQYEEARSLFERALPLARAQQDVREEAYALLGIGGVHYHKGEYVPAGSYFEQALALFESLSDAMGLAKTYRFRGSLHYMRGDPQQALADYRKALGYCEQTGDQAMKARLLFNMSMVPTLTPEEGSEYLRAAYEIARQLRDKEMAGRILHSWGDILTNEGQFAEANEKLEQAASLLEQLGNREPLARLFTSMGRLFRLHGQAERAIEMYHRALEIQQGIGDRTGVIQSYNAMGVAYQAMRDYRKAGECYQRALDLALEAGSERIIDFMKGALASNYLNLREYARAAELFEHVVSRGKDSALDYRQNGLAEAYYHLGRYEDGLSVVQKAIAARREQHSGELLDSLILRAKVLGKLQRTVEALADVREGMRLVEEQRAKTIPADFLKRGYGERVQGYYSLAVDLLFQAGRAQEALEVAEQGRARAFLDLLATREVTLGKAKSAEVAELRGMESQLRKEGADPAEFGVAIPPGLVTRGASPAPAASPLWNRWKGIDLELRSLVAAEAFSAEQLAATAKRLHSTILSYWVDGEATYIWVVRADGTVQAARSPVSRERLAEMIGTATGDSQILTKRGDPAASPEEVDPPASALTTRGGMTLQLNASSKQAWRQLYDALIRPIRDQLPKRVGSRLTIIPHGPLFRLSFAALLDEPNLYLIEQYELHYAPAGAVLEFTHKKVHLERPGTGKYLLVADPANMPHGEGDRKLPPLPGARAEVADTARLLPAGTVTMLGGPAATEIRVRGELRTGRVIHFATHGIVRDESPLDSFLALGTSSNSAAEDGHLTAQDIYGLELNADLIFLSACRSGRGKITGDGVVGLTRSFVYAGTPSVVATLWDVADEPTRRLVPEFYRGYLQHTKPGRALRSAQLRLLSDLRTGRIRISTPAGPLILPEDPALWAAFIVVGEP